MTVANGITQLKPADKPQFIALVRRAFSEDPLFVQLFNYSQSDVHTHKHVNTFLSFLFDKSFSSREELWGYRIDGRLQGIYIVEKPAHDQGRHYPVKDHIRLFMGVLRLLWQLPFKTMKGINTYMRVTRSITPDVTHHYLVMIAVAPEAQGKGVGKALLQHLIQKVDHCPHSQGVGLDTENINNVALYERFGFTLVDEVYLDQLPVYGMFRSKECD